MKYILFTYIIVLFSATTYSQTTLNDVINAALENSADKLQAENEKKRSFWEFENFLANNKPQLVLTGNVPSYIKSNIPVIQPDGNISYESVNYNSSNLGLRIDQKIVATGGTIGLESNLYRFDNFNTNFHQYNNNLLSISYNQPIFQFNEAKWDKKIEPLYFDESLKKYRESVAKISLTATTLYFDALLAQERLEIAEQNIKNNQEILKLANKKLELGEISKNEVLMVNSEMLKAENLLLESQRDYEITILSLKSFSNLITVKKLLPPTPNYTEILEVDKIIEQAKKNRSDFLTHKIALLEAERDIAKARGANGLSITIDANLGFTKTAVEIEDVYSETVPNQYFQVSFALPILDWGRSKSKIKTAEAQRDVIFEITRQKEENLIQEIYTETTLFNLLIKQIKISELSDKITDEVYEITKETYKIGNLPVTDLSLSFTEKFRANQNNIAILGNYWKSFYKLKLLTLYNFAK